MVFPKVEVLVSLNSTPMKKLFPSSNTVLWTNKILKRNTRKSLLLNSPLKMLERCPRKIKCKKRLKRNRNNRRKNNNLRVRKKKKKRSLFPRILMKLPSSRLNRFSSNPTIPICPYMKKVDPS